MLCQFCSSAGCDFTDVYVHAKSLQSCLSVTPWTAAPKALLSMGFTRQEPWSGSRAPQGVVPGLPGSCPGRCARHHCAAGRPSQTGLRRSDGLPVLPVCFSSL